MWSWRFPAWTAQRQGAGLHRDAGRRRDHRDAGRSDEAPGPSNGRFHRRRWTPDAGRARRNCQQVGPRYVHRSRHRRPAGEDHDRRSHRRRRRRHGRPGVRHSRPRPAGEAHVRHSRLRERGDGGDRQNHHRLADGRRDRRSLRGQAHGRRRWGRAPSPRGGEPQNYEAQDGPLRPGLRAPQDAPERAQQAPRPERPEAEPRPSQARAAQPALARTPRLAAQEEVPRGAAEGAERPPLRPHADALPRPLGPPLRRDAPRPDAPPLRGRVDGPPSRSATDSGWRWTTGPDPKQRQGAVAAAPVAWCRAQAVRQQASPAVDAPRPPDARRSRGDAAWSPPRPSWNGRG